MTEAKRGGPVKLCGACEKENPAAARTCRHCGAKFMKKRKPAKKREPEKPVDNEMPEFCVGPGDDGGLMLAWPREQEFVFLTKAELDLLRRVVHPLPAPVHVPSSYRDPFALIGQLPQNVGVAAGGQVVGEG